mgnify:CR=1 FL=1
MSGGSGGVVSRMHVITSRDRCLLRGQVLTSFGGGATIVVLDTGVEDKSNFLQLDGARGSHLGRLTLLQCLVILPLAVHPLAQTWRALGDDTIAVDLLILQQLLESLIPIFLQMLRGQVDPLPSLEYEANFGQIGDALAHGIGRDLHVGMPVVELPALTSNLGREVAQIRVLRRHLQVPMGGRP